jgi:UDPglucose--hexose-1-phosphate uridylyltransferase
VSRTDAAQPVHYDPACYLCPGNTRAGGHRNPQYEGTFVFDNDYAALLPDAPLDAALPHGPLLRAEPERGLCRVVCFHPDHGLTLARMQTHEIERVVDVWTAQYKELGAMEWVRHVQIFENRGAMMGASNPHPHGQIWATEHIPDAPLAELAAQQEHLQTQGRCLLCDYVQLETEQAERIVCANEEFVALVPFWAVWPFETLVLPRRHAGSLAGMDVAQKRGLADVLRRLTTRYDNLFAASFPYTMGLHQAPTDGLPHAEWHFHAHFYPPLLR